jgi:hypothetical protein
MAIDDDDTVIHLVIERAEPIQPHWVRIWHSLALIALAILGIASLIAAITGSPWTEVLSRVTNLMTMVVLVVSVVLWARLAYVMKRERQELARIETRMYKSYLDLKVENDRAGRPPLPPPPDH